MERCKIGNNQSSAWCQPCRAIGECLSLRVPVGVEDRSVPRPLNPKLTAEQECIVRELMDWFGPKRAGLDQDDITGEDAHQLFCHPRQLWALWRKGWVVRSMMDSEGRPAFDKWMLTPAAVAVCRDSDSDTHRQAETTKIGSVHDQRGPERHRPNYGKIPQLHIALIL
jgi:hypothetical protein